MSEQRLKDLEYELELKNAEIDELNMDIQDKTDEINKLKLYSTKLKYANKNLEDKLDTKIDYDKARIKELDDLSQKIKEKDSIIEDKEAESNRALREVNAGLMSKAEYREKIFGETPEIAKQEIKKIQEEEPNIDDLLGTKNEE